MEERREAKLTKRLHHCWLHGSGSSKSTPTHSKCSSSCQIREREIEKTALVATANQPDSLVLGAALHFPHGTQILLLLLLLLLPLPLLRWRLASELAGCSDTACSTRPLQTYLVELRTHA